MKRKSAIVVLFLYIMIIFFITGCEATNDSFDEFSVKTEDLSPITLKFFMLGEEKPDMKEVLSKVAEASKLNIKLDFNWTGNDGYYRYYDAVKAAMASGEAFDAFICGKAVPGRMNAADMLRNGEIKDITVLLPEYAPAIAQRLTDADRAAASADGKLVAVPVLFNDTESISAFIRKDLAEKYRITAINTFDDYEAFLKKVKENEENLLPGAIGGGDFYDIDFISRAFNYVVLEYTQFLVYKWDDPDMKIVPWEQTPEFKDTVSMISDWVKKGLIEQLYNNKKEVASFIGRTGNFEEGTTELDLPGNGNKTIYNSYILFKDKKFQRKGSLDREISSFAFNSNSSSTERSLMFLNWVQSSQENYDLLMYGIEGRHYVLKEGRIGMPEGMPDNANPYIGWYNTPFLNQGLIRQSVNSISSESSERMAKEYLDKFTAFAPHTGFHPDFRAIQSICNDRSRLYLVKIVDTLNKGSYDTTQTDNIIEELRNAGTQKIVAETQSQLDKWRSVNK